MKICILTRGYPTVREGGLPTVCANLAEGLVEKGHDVHVITMSNPNGKTYEKSNGVHVTYANCPSMRYTKEWDNEANKLVRTLNPDIIYSESAAGHGVVPNFKCPSFQRLHGFSFEELLTVVYGRLRTRSEFNQHDIDVMNIKLRQTHIDAEDSRKYTALVGITKLAYDNIKSVLYPKETYFIHNGIKIPKLIEGKRKSVYDFIFVGTLTKEKGIVLFLDLIKRISEEYKIKSVIVGGGDTNAVNNFVNSNGLDVDVTGPLSNDKVIEYYQKSDFFVNPTYHYTGFDTTIMEATMCGCIPIVSFGDNTKEFIDNNHIYSFERGDFESLYNTVIKAIKEFSILDDKGVEMLRTMTRVYGIDNFCRSKMVREHIKMFERYIK